MGFIKEEQKDLIRSCHEIMGNGSLTACNKYISSGCCLCCKFDTGLDNWIGLLPGEENYIKEGDIDNLYFLERLVDNKKVSSLECKRYGLNCTNKPLDCKIYPFFPLEIFGNHIVLLAGFPKCSMYTCLEHSKNKDVETSLMQLEVGIHLLKVALVGVLLANTGYSDWMKLTGSNYKGYSNKYIVNYTTGTYNLL